MSQIKKQWYYRLWFIVTLITVVLSGILALLLMFDDFYLFHREYLWDLVVDNLKTAFTIILVPSLVFALFYGLLRAIIYVVYGQLEKEITIKTLYRDRPNLRKIIGILFSTSVVIVFLLSFMRGYVYLDSNPSPVYLKMIGLTDFTKNYTGTDPNAFNAFLELPGEVMCKNDTSIELLWLKPDDGFCNENLYEHVDDFILTVTPTIAHDEMENARRIVIAKLRGVNEINKVTGLFETCLYSHENIDCENSAYIYKYQNSLLLYVLDTVFSIIVTAVYIGLLFFVGSVVKHRRRTFKKQSLN